MTDRMSFHVKGAPHLTEPYHLTAVGLPGVVLLNGVTIEDDPEHGRLITIADLPGLHRAIGLHIVAKPEPITGDELRFIRKQMRMTQKALAIRLRVDVQTVANYEKGKTQMGAADATARLLYALHVLPPEAKPEFVRAFMDAIAALLPAPDMPEALRRKVTGNWRADKVLLAA